MSQTANTTSAPEFTVNGAHEVVKGKGKGKGKSKSKSKSKAQAAPVVDNADKTATVVAVAAAATTVLFSMVSGASRKSGEE